MANAQSDIRNGYSSFTWSNGERFEGRWVNGTIDGTGVYYWSAEHFYVGYWKNGKRNGFGLEVFEDGSYVVRYFKDDNSSTRELSNIGDINTGVGIYTGEKKSGNACGEGSFKWNNGQYFEGYWNCASNSRNGILYVYKSSSPWIVGEWINEIQEGYGCVVTDNGITVGFWVNGELVTSTNH